MNQAPEKKEVRPTLLNQNWFLWTLTAFVYLCIVVFVLTMLDAMNLSKELTAKRDAIISTLLLGTFISGPIAATLVVLRGNPIQISLALLSPLAFVVFLKIMATLM